MICDRCGKETRGTIMSRFNTDTICFACEQTERQHPSYAEAADVERRAVESGNYNFPGIGLPANFQRWVEVHTYVLDYEKQVNTAEARLTELRKETP